MARPPRKREKIRLNLELTPKVRKQIKDLQELSEADTMVEVIRRALAVYDLMLNHYSKNGSAILEYEDGTKERLRII